MEVWACRLGAACSLFLWLRMSVSLLVGKRAHRPNVKSLGLDRWCRRRSLVIRETHRFSISQKILQVGDCGVFLHAAGGGAARKFPVQFLRGHATVKGHRKDQFRAVRLQC